MMRVSAYGAQKFFGDGAVFDHDVAKCPFEAPSHGGIQSVAITTANTAFHSSDLLSTLELNSVRYFRWRDANWGMIGGLLFSSLFWLVFFRIAYPTLTSMLHFLFTRWAV